MGGSKGGCVWVCKLLGVFLLIACAGVIPTMAQVPSGTILGTVKDTTGGVVAGANVTAVSTETNVPRSQMTAEDGSFRFPGLPVGHYDVKVEKSGFKTVTQKDLVLDVGQEAVINFALQVGTESQEVVVTGEAPQVNTTSGTLGGLVNEEKIAELPLNGRNYLDLTLLQPGVTRSVTTVNLGGGTLGTIYSSNGAPVTSNNYALDGAVMQTIFGLNGASAVGTSLGVDGIREYKVVTSAFGAEYGLTMGSQMSIVSKSGSNQFHGDAFEYLRNRVLDARNFFDYSQSQCQNNVLTANPAACPRSPQYQRNNFGGAFGGPIKKDKTFFWAVYEGLRQSKGVPVSSVVPPAACHPNGSTGVPAGPGESYSQPTVTNGTSGGLITVACDSSIGSGAAGAPASSYTINSATANLLALFPLPNAGATGFSYTFVQPTKVNYGQARVDHSLSANDTLFFRFTMDDSLQTIAGAPPAFAGPQITETSTSREQYETLGETHIFSPALLNTVHLSFSRTIIPTINTLASNLYDPTVSFNCPSGTAPCFQGAGDISIGGYSIWGPDNPIPNYHLQDIATLSDDVFYTKGKHALKFGFLGNRYTARAIESAARRGVVRFTAGGAAGCPSSNLTLFLQDVCAQEQAQDFGGITDRTFNWYTLGFYAQDDWRVTPRLTLNLGLRYEFNTTLREQHGLDSAVVNIFNNQNAIPSFGPIVANQSYSNFGPRIGFAYDVFGDGKMAVHGAFGVYYDVTAGLGQAVLSQTNNDPPFNSSQTTASNQVFAPNFVRGNPIFVPITSAMIANPALYISSFPAGTLGMTGPAYPSPQPYLMQWNLSVDRQLPWDTALSVGYVGTRGLHLWNNTENNPCIPTNQALLGDPTVFPNWAGGSCPNKTTTAGALIGACPAGTNINIQCTANGRFNPHFGTMAGESATSESWYDGLQVGLTRRLRNGLEFQSAYTYSRAIDTTEGLIIVDGSFSSTASNLKLVDKGPAQTNATHNWRFNTIYHIPDLKSDNFGAKFLKGWWVSNILSVQSGYPFSPFLGSQVSGSGQQGGGPNNADRASLVTPTIISALQAGCPGNPVGTVVTPTGYAYGFPCPSAATIAALVPYNASTVITGIPNPATPAAGVSKIGWFNGNMFIQQQAGFLGNAGRNILLGPGLFDWDLSVNKDTRLPFLGEAGMVEFKADFFNILNRANFGLPSYGGGGTGVITQGGAIPGTVTDARDIQLALKIMF